MDFMPKSNYYWKLMIFVVFVGLILFDNKDSIFDVELCDIMVDLISSFISWWWFLETKCIFWIIVLSYLLSLFMLKVFGWHILSISYWSVYLFDLWMYASYSWLLLKILFFFKSCDPMMMNQLLSLILSCNDIALLSLDHFTYYCTVTLACFHISLMSWIL